MYRRNATNLLINVGNNNDNLETLSKIIQHVNTLIQHGPQSVAQTGNMQLVKYTYMQSVYTFSLLTVTSLNYNFYETVECVDTVEEVELMWQIITLRTTLSESSSCIR